MTKFARHAAVFACLSSAVGCADQTPGSVLVDYRIGNDKTCAEAGVTNLDIVLSQEDGISGGGPCNDEPILLEGIPVGKYAIDITGSDANGVVIVDNVDASPTVVDITGDGKELSPTQIPLSDTPAELLVRWNFGFTSCESAGISKFLIEAFDDSGSENFVSVELDCTEAGDAAGYREVPDDQRELNGRRFGEVGVQARAADGSPVGPRVNFAVPAPGPGYKVYLTLECDQNGCTSTGAPD